MKPIRGTHDVISYPVPKVLSIYDDTILVQQKQMNPLIDIHNTKT